MTLKQHRRELPEAANMRIPAPPPPGVKQYCTENVFSPPYDFLNVVFSLAYFIGRIQYIIHRTRRTAFYVIGKTSGQR